MDPKIQTSGEVSFRNGLKGGANGVERVMPGTELKAEVALKVLTGVKPVDELAGQYQVDSTQISQ